MQTNQKPKVDIQKCSREIAADKTCLANNNYNTSITIRKYISLFTSYTFAGIIFPTHRTSVSGVAF